MKLIERKPKNPSKPTKRYVSLYRDSKRETFLVSDLLDKIDEDKFVELAPLISKEDILDSERKFIRSIGRSKRSSEQKARLVELNKILG